MSRRSEALAARIEEGAGALATLARGLDDTQWNTVVPGDGRTVGVIVHHVASIYTVEVDLTMKLAQGDAIQGLTWDDVAKLNAGHAHDNASAGKQETLDLLALNSKKAADAVRALSDEQLDRAAPISLNSDAPLTTQFFIEDHELRHSFHHLAKIKKVLGSN